MWILLNFHYSWTTQPPRGCTCWRFIYGSNRTVHTWNYLAVCKQIWIISIRQQYLNPFNCVKIERLMLDFNTRKHLAVCKQYVVILGSFKNVTSKLFNKSNIYKQDLTLNNFIGLIYHKPNQTTIILYFIFFDITVRFPKEWLLLSDPWQKCRALYIK